MAFKETDLTVFVGRREDGALYGVWTVRQWEGQEEMLHDDLEIVTFQNKQPPKAGDMKPTSPIVDPRIKEQK